jgi:hypothetical protein
MIDEITQEDFEAIKRQAEFRCREYRKDHNLRQTAAVFEVSTIEVGDICGTSMHPDRKRQIYHVETAFKMLQAYERNKDKIFHFDKNPDLKKKESDKF